MDRVLDICQKYGLKMVQIEEKVYKNSTAEKIVNIDKLKRDLEKCWFLISNNEMRKTGYGFSESYAMLYYIIDDNSRDLLLKIYHSIEDEYDQIYVDYFEERPEWIFL